MDILPKFHPKFEKYQNILLDPERIPNWIRQRSGPETICKVGSGSVMTRQVESGSEITRSDGSGSEKKLFRIRHTARQDTYNS